MNHTRRRKFALTLGMLVPLASLAMARPAMAQQAETVVTDAENGAAVTLNAGEILVVRLKENPSTGYSRALVSFPNMPIRLISQRLLPVPARADGVPTVGAPRVSEWRFEVVGKSTAARAVWLKMLSLRPFAKGVDAAGLWEMRVTVPAAPAE